MTLSGDTGNLIRDLGTFRDTPLYQLISYIHEKNAEDRKFLRVKKEFPEMFADMESLEFLISHEILWIEMNGTVRPGTFAEHLYLVVSKATLWKKE